MKYKVSWGPLKTTEDTIERVISVTIWLDKPAYNKHYNSITITQGFDFEVPFRFATNSYTTSVHIRSQCYDDLLAGAELYRVAHKLITGNHKHWKKKASRAFKAYLRAEKQQTLMVTAKRIWNEAGITTA